MAAKRVPLGLTWDQHVHFASKVRDLWELVYGPHSDKTKPQLCGKLFDLTLKLAVEMSAYVSRDCKGTAYNPMRDDPYDAWKFSEAKPEYNFTDARIDLIDLRERLLPTNPTGKAVKIIDTMLAAMSKAGA